MARTTPRAGVAGLLTAMLCMISAPPVVADAGWFESGDTQLRLDLQLLNDAEVIRLPVNQWPLPRAAVQYALTNRRDHFATNAAVQAALARVRMRASESKRWIMAADVTAGEPGLLRDFDTIGRETGELAARAEYAAGNFAARLAVAGVTNPDDDEALRLDGSHATVQLGNWLMSAHTLDRWWGPSHESSLILSNNARPMPTLAMERAAAMPWESKWLSWLGPWRLNLALSHMEGEREDIDKPLFLAARFMVMPFKDIELGFSRTAQFCGEQLTCTWSSFWNMLIGNDNVGIDATPENEPGNQMAGFDVRWASPIGNWPYAIYSQMIGEDESSYTPAKYLQQFGFETWMPLDNGGLLQVFAEYSSTTCSANTGRGPYYNCAYTQGRFNVEGYRYRGRVIGHTTDNDAETYSLGGSFTSNGGDLWTATARISSLNHDGIDTRNTVSSGPADYAALELGWKGSLFGENVHVDLGIQSLEPEGATRDVDLFGFVGWRHSFEP